MRSVQVDPVHGAGHVNWLETAVLVAVEQRTGSRSHGSAAGKGRVGFLLFFLLETLFKNCFVGNQTQTVRLESVSRALIS